MIRYIALLRGINISGKNKISMSELKISFEELNFIDVKTHFNSGNVIFYSEIKNKEELILKIKIMIKDKFNLDIPTIVITKEELKEFFDNAPDWWNNDNKEIYDNIIFIIPPTKYEEVYSEIGDAKEEYEKIKNYKDVIYWSFNLKDYSKTNWIKTASSKINDEVTIRTANTMKKILELS